MQEALYQLPIVASHYQLLVARLLQSAAPPASIDCGKWGGWESTNLFYVA